MASQLQSYTVDVETAERLALHMALPVAVPSDRRFHVIKSLEIPEGVHRLTLELDLLVQRSYPAPFEMHLMMIREDRWVPAVFWTNYKCSNFEQFTRGWEYKPRVAELIRSDKPYTYHLLAMLDSPMHLQARVDVVNHLIEKVNPDD